MGQEESKPHSVIYEPPANDDETGVYVNSICIEENGGRPLTAPRSLPDAHSIYEILKANSVRYANRDAFGYRPKLPEGKFGPYVWFSYKEFELMVREFASGLYALGVRKGYAIGIFSHSCYQWQIVNHAACLLGAILVPVYDSFGPNAAQYIVQHAEIKVLVVAKPKVQTTKSLLEAQKVDKVILINDPGEKADIDDWTTIDEVLEMGRNNMRDFPMPDGDDDSIILYTSGSTGNPKGCLFDNKARVCGLTGMGNYGGGLVPGETHFSFLPLAHAFELNMEAVMSEQGVRIGYFCGNTANVVDDCQALQPTYIQCVPRVWNRIYAAMNKTIDGFSPFKKWMIKTALKYKQALQKEGKPTSLLLDMAIFSNFARVIGGRTGAFISGGAPILPEVYYFLRATICPNFCQGYGLTETFSTGTVAYMGNTSPAHVGFPFVMTAIKLRRVPDMEYDPKAEQPSGEIMIRSGSMMKGYYKQPELTKEVMFGDFIATGDIGRIDSEGHLEIIDRVKQLVKLSQGEYISLTELTDQYASTEGVANIFVYADSLHDYPIAVVIPTPNQMKIWKENGMADFLTNPKANEEMLKKLHETADKFKMVGFKRIKKIILDDVDFTVENGLLTPSVKVQFNGCRKKYEARLIEIYN